MRAGSVRYTERIVRVDGRHPATASDQKDGHQNQYRDDSNDDVLRQGGETLIGFQMSPVLFLPEIIILIGHGHLQPLLSLLFQVGSDLRARQYPGKLKQPPYNVTDGSYRRIQERFRCRNWGTGNRDTFTFHPRPALRNQFQRPRIAAMLGDQHAVGKRVIIVPFENRNDGLKDDRPFVHRRADEMNGATGEADAGLDRAGMSIQSLERGEQRWMDVDQPVMPALDKA